jgi:hypothetical protein
MAMRLIFILLPAFIIASAVDARALDGGPCYSTAGLSCQNMRITVCPRGDFEQIRNGCGGAGDYIWIEARDAANYPIPGIPWTDYWMNACDAAQALSLCVEAIAADSLTGENGRTTFSGIFRAGGCVLTGGLYVAIQGQSITTTPTCATRLCLGVVIKGPDLTGASGKPDGVVNLSDLIPFGTSYNKNLGQGGYSACCDFNDDDKCNLSDFAYFGQHYQHACL